MARNYLLPVEFQVDLESGMVYLPGAEDPVLHIEPRGTYIQIQQRLQDTLLRLLTQ